MEKIKFTMEEYADEFKIMVDALDEILFTAVLDYLDPTKGYPTEEIANNVATVRRLLEQMRKELEM